MTRHQKLTVYSGQRLKKKTCYTCLLNLALLFNCKHAVAVRQMQICMDFHFAVGFKRQETKRKRINNRPLAVVCTRAGTGTLYLDPCLLYFGVQSPTNSMGLTAQIKGLILCSSGCCFFFFPPFLQKKLPQGSGFIVFSSLSSLKITHKANN